jgi:hypothetical protein
MAISRAMMRRQLRSQGGIMQLTNRDPYFLGGVVKSVKKAVSGAVDTVTDFAKSDVGKIALLAAGGYYLGGLGGATGLSRFSPAAMKAGLLGTVEAGTGLYGGGVLSGLMNTGVGQAITGGLSSKALGTGAAILGGSALMSSLFGSPEQAKQLYSERPSVVREYLAQYYRNINKDREDLTDAEVEQFVNEQTREYAANGGRIGFEEGGTFLTMEEAAKRDPAMFMDTTTYNPIPADADRQGAAEIAKVIMGTRELPREEGEIEDESIMSSTQFIFEKYVMPKRKELMENFGLSLEEADELIKEEMVKLKTKTVERDKKGLGGLITKMINNNPEIFKKLQMSSPVKQLQARYMMNLNPKMEEEEVMDYIRENAAYGGPIGEPRENQQGIKELDYRKEGGFVPVGIKEKADDVPAMLSKNEFVMTADAVRGAGNGDVEKGAQRMYKVMKTLENGGRI